MSAVVEQIKNDRMAALRGRRSEEKELLDYIYGQVQLREKDPNAKGDHGIAVIKAYVKSAHECIATYDADHQDAVDKYKRELAILDKYLPKAIGEDELKSAIDEIKATGETSKGGIMKALKEKYGDALDGKLASSLI